VRQVTKTTAAGGGTPVFKYDLNGNMVDGDGRQVDFDERDRPIRVLMGALTTEFKYGPDGQRHQQKLTGGGAADFSPKTVYYVDKAYELTVWGPGSSSPFELEERTFIGGSVVVLTTKSVTGTVDRRVRYQHVDRLGSVEAVTTEEPPTPELELDGHGFDPWGRPRARDWSPSLDRLHPGGEPGVASTRGFTGHEHLDATYLIHMNGRVYDYRLGRFLSVDPIISNPANSQSINPYSYIGNDPLSGTDPTGYNFESICERNVGSHCVDLQPWGPLPPEEKKVATGSGAVAAKTTQHGSNPPDAGGTTEVNKEQPSELGKAFTVGAGVFIGTLEALIPGGFILGSPDSSNPDLEAGRAIGLGVTGFVQMVVGLAEVGGGGAAGVAAAPESAGASLVLGGVVVVDGAVRAAQGAVSVAAGAAVAAQVQEMRGSGAGGQPERGVGGSGWRGDAQWRGAVRQVGQGGTIESIGGRVPTASEARALIKESGGRVLRTEPPHPSPNPHNYPHINYTTSSGAKGTIRILE
jgi:RHS repeat-associated protein